jgi:hypothetical protein
VHHPLDRPRRAIEPAGKIAARRGAFYHAESRCGTPGVAPQDGLGAPARPILPAGSPLSRPNGPPAACIFRSAWSAAGAAAPLPGISPQAV